MPNIVVFALRWCNTHTRYPQYCRNFDNKIHYTLTLSLQNNNLNDDVKYLTEEEMIQNCTQSSNYIWYDILLFLGHEMLYNWYIFIFCQAHTEKYEKYKLSEFSYTYFKTKILFRKTNGKNENYND